MIHLPSPFLRAFLGCAIATSLVSLSAPPVLAQQAPAPAQVAPVSVAQYVLRFGDAINMRVVGNEQLLIEKQPIRPDGRISLPLIGEVQAGGLTVPQFQDRVRQAFQRYIVDPQVVINVAEFRPLQISLMGFVNKPDTYVVKEPIRLVQALALAGGADRRRGDLTRVLVLRPSGERTMVDVMAVLEGRVDQNLMLFDGDTVRVEEVYGPDWLAILGPISTIAATLAAVALFYERTR
ncbi:MAG: polysaccharide biosynthesis/export family protein [Candidatus Sericytochromatia bacterium]